MKAPMQAYKTKIREFIDLRPSGTKGRIAKALGTHRSFVSQIINPTNKTPIPAQHLEKIFDICHFSSHEKASFLSLYHKAHPPALAGTASVANGKRNEIVIKLPSFRQPKMRKIVEETICEFAVRVIEIAHQTESNQS